MCAFHFHCPLVRCVCAGVCGRGKAFIYNPILLQLVHSCMYCFALLVLERWDGVWGKGKGRVDPCLFSICALAS